MNTFYTTMSHVDQDDLDSEMIYGITAKENGTGKVMFAEYNISFDFSLVQELADICQKNQPDEEEFENLISSHKIYHEN